ncbi:GNAT family N-acetyltransferase [Bacillus sp. 2205SS5-2]|uniref:GNAT family N-acetyltransferase n=1 Tax=Bacillus sp. 2205SS5-2 TaxID=3109031 RepID=UPI0030064864
MNYRQLDEKDASDYLQLRLEALKISPDAFASTLEEALQKDNPIDQTKNRLNSPTSITFGAIQNDALVGVATLLLSKNQKLKHKGEVVAVYVTPEFRGAKISRELMNQLIAYAKSTNLSHIKLTVVSTNIKAISLYHTLGFEVFGLEKHSMKDTISGGYIDELLMQMHL